MLRHVDALRADQPRVGTRNLHDHLAEVGVAVGRDRLFTLLRETDRLVKRKRRGTHTTYSRHGYAVAPNHLKTLTVTAPQQVVVSDITYLALARGAFAYLFLVTDLYARKILGWHVRRDLSHVGALHALAAAMRDLTALHGLVHHSDRGSQYCCHDYLHYLAQHHVLPSMTDANHCYQNAVAERVNGILKDEFNLDAVFPTVYDAQAAVARAVHTYNTLRKHGSLNRRTPHEVFHQHPVWHHAA